VFRKDLIKRLLARPHTVDELAREVDATPREVADDLRHLLRSLKHEPYRAIMEPARCRHCGFAFRADRISKPGKCPRCRSTWIEPPRVHIEPA